MTNFFTYFKKNMPNLPLKLLDQIKGILTRFIRVPGYRSGGPGFDSRHYQGKKVMGLERGPLSLVSTTEELLDRKIAAAV
jgi:hypothetical protein